jgi:hypothetical protein
MAEQQRKTAKPFITKASNVRTAQLRFLIPKRVPRGALTLIAGYPGKGKSLWTAEIAACLTRGEFGDPPAKVLFMGSEDTVEHVYVPRLIAARAVLDSVDFVDLRIAGGDDEEMLPAGSLRFPDNAAELAEIVQDGDYRLLVIDPVLGHINTRLISAFKDEQLREYLFDPLALIAQTNDCAVVGVMHFNKRAEGEALLRLSGSAGGIAGPARSVLYMHDSPDDPDDRILTIAKGNYAKTSESSLRYTIEEVPVDLDDGSRALIPHLVYTDKSEYGTEDLLGGGQSEGPAVTELVEFLKAELANGPRLVTELLKLAGEMGLSTNKTTWAKARRQLGIKPQKDGYQGPWMLGFPEEPRIKVRSKKKTGEPAEEE